MTGTFLLGLGRHGERYVLQSTTRQAVSAQLRSAGRMREIARRGRDRSPCRMLIHNLDIYRKGSKADLIIQTTIPRIIGTTFTHNYWRQELSPDHPFTAPHRPDPGHQRPRARRRRTSSCSYSWCWCWCRHVVYAPLPRREWCPCVSRRCVCWA